MKRKLHLILIVFLLLSTCIIVSGCKSETADGAKNDTEPEQDSVVTKRIILFSVKEVIQHVTIEVTGSLNPIRKSMVNALEDGVCLGYLTPDKRASGTPGELLPGRKVKKGEILIEFENKVLDQQIVNLETQLKTYSYGVDTLEVNEAESALIIATTNLERMKTLFEKKKSISQAAYELALMRYQQAKAGYDKLKLQIEALKKNLKVLMKRKQDLFAKAPYDGRIDKVFINPGEKAISMTKTPLYVIVDDSMLDFTFGVPEEYGMYLDKIATKVKIKLPNGMSIESSLTAVSPLVNPINRNIECKARIKGIQGGQQIPAGIFARADITFEIKGIFVPSTSIVSYEDLDYCFVTESVSNTKVDELKKKPVSRGILAGSMVQLIGSNTLKGSIILKFADEKYLSESSIRIGKSDIVQISNDD